jgi:CheY-like chemotaxis protein
VIRTDKKSKTKNKDFLQTSSDYLSSLYLKQLPLFAEKPLQREVLLVDDDLVFLRIMSQYLGEGGYGYKLAQDGQQAWYYLQRYQTLFFVVLADRIMPKLHGLELLAKMQLSSLRKVPLILCTGEACKAERREAILQGVYDFFYKPISKELLLSALRKIENSRDEL